MFTLLPEKNMKLVTREYRLRLVATALALFVVATILGMVLLSPSLVLIQNREKLVTTKLDTILASQKKLLAANPDEIAKGTKEMIRLLTTRSQVTSVSALLDRIVSHQIEGVRLTALDYSLAGAGATVVVSGVASTRQVLSAFVKRLEADGALGTVSIPVSNFTKSTNLEFSLSIQVKTNTL
ncbi:MAG: hypothetical protein RLZZ347_676 [Candidatus Parcubacteria bacterium]|jgi:Tfp pilus assembly protein PilN